MRIRDDIKNKDVEGFIYDGGTEEEAAIYFGCDVRLIRRVMAGERSARAHSADTSKLRHLASIIPWRDGHPWYMKVLAQRI